MGQKIKSCGLNRAFEELQQSFRQEEVNRKKIALELIESITYQK